MCSYSGIQKALRKLLIQIFCLVDYSIVHSSYPFSITTAIITNLHEDFSPLLHNVSSQHLEEMKRRVRHLYKKGATN